MIQNSAAGGSKYAITHPFCGRFLMLVFINLRPTNVSLIALYPQGYPCFGQLNIVNNYHHSKIALRKK